MRQLNAPVHVRRKSLSSMLSKDLRKKYGLRNVSVRAGDKVKVLRGQYKGTVGKIERTDMRTMRVFVTGVEVTRKSGQKVQYPLHASNLMITDLALSDKRRMKRTSAKQDSTKAKPAKSETHDKTTSKETRNT